MDNQRDFYHVSDLSILIVIMFGLKEGLNMQLSLKITRPYAKNIMECVERFSEDDMSPCSGEKIPRPSGS